MKILFVAVFIGALALFCVPGAGHSGVDHRVIGTGGHASFGLLTAREILRVQGKAQGPLERISSEPASIALFGAGLLLVGGVIRRQRSKAAPRRREHSQDRVYPVEKQFSLE